MSYPKLFFADNSGKHYSSALINGYHIREYVLEDVMFRVTITQEEGSMPELTVNLNDEEDVSYLVHNFISITDLLAVVKDFAASADTFDATEDHADLYLTYEGADPDYGYTFEEFLFKFR